LLAPNRVSDWMNWFSFTYGSISGRRDQRQKITR
jgi:hypothetical protein